MSTINMIQASEAEQVQLPESPVGLMELTDADLGEVGGGWFKHGPYCRRLGWFSPLCLCRVTYHIFGYSFTFYYVKRC